MAEEVVEVENTEENPKENNKNKNKNKNKNENVTENMSASTNERVIDRKEMLELIKKFLLEKSGDTTDNVLKYVAGKSGDVLSRILEFYGMQQILDRMAGKGGSLEDVLKFAILRDMLRPQMDLTQMIALMKAVENKSNSSDEIMKLLLTLQQQQMQQTQQLLMMMFGNKIQELQTQMQQQRQDLLEYLQSLENRLAVAPSLDEELQRYIKFRETMLRFAEQEGLTKEQVTTQEGKVNWAALLNRIIKIAERGIDAFSKKPPEFNLPPQLPSLPEVKPVETPKEIKAPKGFTLPKTEISYGESTSQPIEQQEISEEVHSAGVEKAEGQ